MRRIIVLLLIVSHQVFAQTNTFPSSGNVGIGTLSPNAGLEVVRSSNIGGVWNPNGSIFTTAEGANSLIMDTNEIYGSGTLYLGSKSGDIIKFRTVSDSGYSDKVVIKANGYVGIGITNPTEKLEVNGRIKSEAISLNGNNSVSTVNGFGNKIEFIGYNGAIVLNPGQTSELMFGLHSNGNFYWGTGGVNATNPNYYSMYLNGNNGNLGIRGKLTSNEVKVKIGGWADYVFAKDYDLPTLEEVEKHINTKGHLINMPSAEEVEANGIELGEMNRLLLEKIEELTLYILNQNQKQKQQEGRIKMLETNNNLIKPILK